MRKNWSRDLDASLLLAGGVGLIAESIRRLRASVGYPVTEHLSDPANAARDSLEWMSLDRQSDSPVGLNRGGFSYGRRSRCKIIVDSSLMIPGRKLRSHV